MDTLSRSIRDLLATASEVVELEQCDADLLGAARTLWTRLAIAQVTQQTRTFNRTLQKLRLIESLRVDIEALLEHSRETLQAPGLDSVQVSEASGEKRADAP